MDATRRAGFRLAVCLRCDTLYVAEVLIFEGDNIRGLVLDATDHVWLAWDPKGNTFLIMLARHDECVEARVRGRG